MIAILIATLTFLISAAGMSQSQSEKVVNQTSISIPQKPGSMQGLSGNISINGNKGNSRYRYSIPSFGWKSVEPTISISYSSGGGSGVLGQGFDLDIDSIQRITRLGVPSNSSGLHGSVAGDLVKVSENRYRARNGTDLSDYVLDGNVISHLGQNGHKRLYGKSKNAREQDEGYTYKWSISSVVDEAGNKSEFQYFSHGNVSYIERVMLTDKSGSLRYSIIFKYREVDQRQYSYANGLRQEYTRALSSVEGLFHPTEGGANRVYRVEFDYRESFAGVGRLVLEGIRRYGQTNEDSYPSVSLSYSKLADFQNPIVEEIDFKEGLGVSVDEVQMLDFDGDGRLDIVYRSSRHDGKWAIAYNEGKMSGDGEFRFKKMLLPDIHQEVDFLKNKSIADLNGDLLLDVVDARSAEGLQGYLNVSSLNQYQRYWDTQKPVSVEGIEESELSRDTRWVDLNGDGKTEILKSDIGYEYDLYELKSFNSNSYEFKHTHAFKNKDNSISVLEQNRFADINGDGLPEMYEIYQDAFNDQDAELRFFQNSGKSPYLPKLSHENLQVIPIEVVGNTTIASPAENQLVDLNGDGIPELAVAQKYQISIYSLIQGKYVLTFEKKNLCNRGVNDEVGEMHFGDVNGNGSTDLVFGCHEAESKLFYLDFYRNAKVTAPYILTQVSTSTGKKTQFEYTSSQSTYQPGDVKHRLPMTFPILKSMTTTIPEMARTGKFSETPANRTDYRHASGYYDFKKRLFYGFQTVDTINYHSTDLADGLKISTTYRNDTDLLDGRIKSQTTSSIRDGFVYADNQFRYQTPRIIPEKDVWYPHRSSEQRTRYERDGSSKTRSHEFYYTFDSRGLQKESATLEYSSPGKVYRKSKTVYSSRSVGGQVLNLPVQELMENGSGKIIKGVRFDYLDNSARIGSVHRHDGTGWQRQFSYGYNDYGSVSTITDAAGHQTWIDYSGGGQVLPSLITRTVGGITHKKSATYDLSLGGKITSVTDANGHTTRYSYDGLGRLAAIQPPKSAKPTTTYSYQWGTGSSYSTIVERVDGISKPTIQYFDALGRGRGSQSPSETGTVISGYQEFDLGGRVTAAASPLAFSDAGLYEGLSGESLQRLTTTSYDPLSRATQAIYPNGGVARWQYLADSQIHYSPENEPTVSYFDSLDRLCAIDTWNVKSLPEGRIPAAQLGRSCGSVSNTVNDFSAKISRTELGYDALDNIRVIGTTGKPSRYYDYDGLGRLTAFHASDLGYRNWYYDALDRIHTTHVFDGDYQPVSTMFSQYDEMGRTVEQRSLLGRAGDIGKDWNKGTLEFQQVFDRSAGDMPKKLAPAENLVGRLSALRLPTGYSYFYSYDAHGNRTVESLIGNKQTVSMSFGYDHLDRPNQIVYPDNRSIEVGYSKKTGVEQGTWGALDTFVNYSPLMQVAGLKAGKLQQNYQFDALTDRLTKLDASFSGSFVAKYSYDGYDKVARLTSFTGEDLVAESIKKSFQYDLKGQLSQSTIAFKPRDGVAINENYDYSYNAAGEIQQNEGSKLSYERTANGLITKITHGKKSYAFDKLGRLTKSQDNARIVWNAAGRVQTIDGKASKSEFHYLPDNSRYLEIKEVEGKTETKLIFNAFAEKQLDTGEVTDYYFAAGRRVASQKTGQEVEVFLTDMLDSTRMTLNHKGEVVHYSEYRPFGSTLYEKNKAKSPRHRFAGAIFDQETGLYQMGARYYQPSLGRFISPDPLMMLDQLSCATGGNQCTDLWSYTSNDPINKFDPTGYSEAMGHDQHGEDKEREKNGGGRSREAGDAMDRESGPGRDRDVGKAAEPVVNGEVEPGLGEIDLVDDFIETVKKTVKSKMCSSDSCETVVEYTFTATQVVAGGPQKAVKKGAKSAKVFMKNAIKKGSAGGVGAGKKFSLKLKNQVRNENNRCVFCGTETSMKPGPTRSEIDHSIPKSRGGNNTIENAQNTCRSCNRSKGAMTSQEYMEKIGNRYE